MKTKLLLFLSPFLFACNCFGQITFQKVIALNYGSLANAIQQTNDGGYIIVGSALIDTSGNEDICLVKTNTNGDTLWTRTFGGINEDEGYSVQQTSDEGYIVVGYSTSFSQNGKIYVVKTDVNGDTLWTQVYGGTGLEVGNFIHQTSEGGYIIAGSSNSFDGGVDNVYLLKIYANGDVTWGKSYRAANGEAGKCANQTSDSGYVICGSIDNPGFGYSNLYLIKTKANGDTLWTKTYETTNGDRGSAVQQTMDGGYIITGTTSNINEDTNNIFLIKTDAIGDTLWTKTYGGTNYDYGLDIFQTNDSGYIIVGNLNNHSDTSAGAYLIKTNARGDTLWTKIYERTRFSYGASVRQTSDGGYIVLGNTGAFNGVRYLNGLYLIKTDANGSSDCNQGNTNTIVGYHTVIASNINTTIFSGGTAFPANTIVGSGGYDTTFCFSTGVNEQTLNHTITIYPNPATDQLIITGNWKSKVMKLTIYNIQGKKLLSLPLGEGWGGAVNCKPFPSGIYFVTVVFDGELSRTADEKQQWVGRFVKE